MGADANFCECWITRVEDALAGYITLLTDKLEVEYTLLIQEGVKYWTFPSVKIGLLAADPTESLPPVNPYRTMYLELKPLMEALAEAQL